MGKYHRKRRDNFCRAGGKGGVILQCELRKERPTDLMTYASLDMRICGFPPMRVRRQLKVHDGLPGDENAKTRLSDYGESLPAHHTISLHPGNCIMGNTR